MNPTRHPLNPELRSQMVHLLNVALADTLHLRLQLKQAHWNIKGAAFMAVHELLDTIASSVDDASDEIAERAVMLGGTADGTLAGIQQHSTIPSYNPNLTALTDHLVAIPQGLAALSTMYYKAIEVSGTAGDPVTSDLFTGLAASIDKHLWFIEAHLSH
jgi:starvation-inducible DNA-binding protein